MSSVRPRRSALAAFVFAAGLILTGCGTGLDAQTAQAYDAAVGSNSRGGEVEVHNALFVDNKNDTATLSAAFLNKDTADDTLTGVTVVNGDGETIEAKLAEPIPLKPDTLYASGKTADVLLSGSNFAAGDFLTVTFTFTDAAEISIDVPVVVRNEMYDNIAEGPVTPPDAETPEKALTEETETQ